MDGLARLNVKVQPLTHENSQRVLDFMVQSFKESPLVKKKIQKVQDLRRKSAVLFPKLLWAQQELNQMRNTNMFYSAAYTQNDKIVGFVFTCDLVMLLKAIDQIQQDYYYDLLRNHGEKIALGQDVYFGKIVVDKNYMNQGLAKYIILERLEYLDKFGYKTAFGTGTNPAITQHNKNIGGTTGNSMDVKLPDGTIHRIPILLTDIKTGIQGTRKRKQSKEITAKL